MKLLYIAVSMLLWMDLRVSAQVSCPFDRFVRDGVAYAKAGKTELARAKFNSARVCDPSKRDQVDKLEHDMLPNKQPVTLLVANPTATLPGPNEQRKTPDTAQRRITGEVMIQEPNQKAGIDSLTAFFRILYQAKTGISKYKRNTRNNLKVTIGARFPQGRTDALSLYSLRQMDITYYSALLDLGLAEKLLPLSSRGKYKPNIVSATRELESYRRSSLVGYEMPDTVVGLPASVLFAGPSADNKHFAWGYSDYSDYEKLQIRYLSMSLPDLEVTTDSIQPLKDSGLFYSVSSIAGDYKYCVGRGISYRLKPNLVEFGKIDYADPAVDRLMDSGRTVIKDLSDYGSNTFFFSPDASHLAGWKDVQDLAVLDVNTRQQVPLKNANPVPTGSFSDDSKRFAYYNDSTRLIYISDMSGSILEEIPAELTGIDHIADIDFTGSDAFLKVNNDDTVSLFEIAEKKMIARFSRALVNDLAVSSGGKNILLTCKNICQVRDQAYESSVGIVTDMALNVKKRLYFDGSNFFFTPKGDYIVAYGQTAIMRWPVVKSKSTPTTATCLSEEELVKNRCLPLSAWARVTNADLVEAGARAFAAMANDEADSMLKQVYYSESGRLFYELALGNARLTRWERIPFFFDWYNYTEQKMGHRDFGNQFVKELTAVREFDKLANTADSAYPQQLYYTADANYLLENLYDSMRMYNMDLAELIEKEIALRCRVFAKDPQNTSNTAFLIEAFQKLSSVCDTVGRRDLLKGRYAQRLSVYASEKQLLENSMATLPDSFGSKPLYIKSLVQLAPSFLYQYGASHNGRMVGALDSALYYSEKGLALSPHRPDSARLLMVEAWVYLLQPGGADSSMTMCRQIRQSYPEISPKTMLNQLVYLREAGIKRTSAIEKMEEFLKTQEK